MTASRDPAPEPDDYLAECGDCDGTGLTAAGICEFCGGDGER